MAWTERYVRADAAGSGDGTTDTNSGANGAFTLAEAITHSASNTNQRYNVRGSTGAFTNTTTTRTFNGNGTATAPNWWRGYNSTIGDLDNDFITAKPSITFSTGVFVVTGTYQLFTNLSILGTANTSQLVNLTVGTARFLRCRIENQGTNANSRAVNSQTAGQNFFGNCYFKATSSATEIFLMSVPTEVVGCHFVGGGHGINSSASLVAYRNVFNDPGGDGIRFTNNSSFFIVGNTFYSCGSDGFETTTPPGTSSANHTIADNIFSNSAAYDITNSSGTTTSIIIRMNNLSYSPGTAHENGFSDLPAFSNQTDSASPFLNAGTDYSLSGSTNARSNGLPYGVFENSSFRGYADIGAVQAQTLTSARSVIIQNQGAH